MNQANNIKEKETSVTEIGKKSFNPVTEIGKKSFNPVTKIGKSNNKNLTNFSANSITAVTENESFECFCSIFALDPNAEDFAYKYEKIQSEIKNGYNDIKNKEIMLKIIFILETRKFENFEYLRRSLGCINQKVLSNTLKNLQDRNLLTAANLMNSSVKIIRDVKRSNGENKGNKYYQLNYSNLHIAKGINKIKRYLDPTFVQRIEEDHELFMQSKDIYIKDKELKEKTRLTKLERIRDALFELKETDFKTKFYSNHSIYKHLYFGKGIISRSKKEWTEWRNYLIEQGFLKQIDNKGNPLLLITDKCSRK